MAVPFIPFHRPSIGREEIDAVEQVLLSKWLTTGPASIKFEREFAEYIGCKYALTVNSATAALQLALHAIGLKAGDEVLLPTYTFASTAAVVTYFGAKPVFCDSEPGGFNVDGADVLHRFSPSTRAIIPVHIGGQPCEMNILQAMAKERGLHIIEDAAHALPAKFEGKYIGTLSPLTAFSFYATKTITTAEGGMLTTDNEEYARTASMMRLHGISGDAWKRYSREGSWYYEVLQPGFKLNMCDVLASLGSAQLQKCNAFWERRSEIAARYVSRFSEIQELETPPLAAVGSQHSWHLFILRLRLPLLAIHRNQFIEELKKLGVGTSVHFIPLHLHPFYSREYGYRPGDLPNAEDAYGRCISLPIYPDLTDHEIDHIIRCVEQVVQKNRKRELVAA